MVAHNFNPSKRLGDRDGQISGVWSPAWFSYDFRASPGYIVRI